MSDHKIIPRPRKQKPVTPRDEHFYDRGKEAGHKEAMERMREVLLIERGEALAAGALANKHRAVEAGTVAAVEMVTIKRIAAKLGLDLEQYTFAKASARMWSDRISRQDDD